MKIKSLLSTLVLSSSLLFASTGLASEHDEITEAQKRLEEAAREYAELTSGLKGDDANVFVKSFKFPQLNIGSKARLGIHIGESVKEENVNGVVTREESNQKGVKVVGLAEDGPAEKAGMKEGDIITHLNGKHLLDGDKGAMKELLGIMKDVNPGDRVDVTYERDGLSNVAALITDEMPDRQAVFLDGFPGNDFDIEVFEGPDGLNGEKHILKRFGKGMHGDHDFRALFIHDSPLGDAELVELSPELGEYFKATEGLLVVRAPSDESTPLRDGDVIQSIDGRAPDSVSHAMRILRSYDTGEVVNLNIKRKKRNKTVSITIPESKDLSSYTYFDGLKKWKQKKEKVD